MRSKFRKFGLDIIYLDENISHTPSKPSIEEENKNDSLEDSINLFLEKALMRQRDEIMKNFSNILQRMSIEKFASLSSDHFGSTSPFNLQVNFDIPIFEGRIEADALDKWLNLLEGYFFVHNFSDRENIISVLMKDLPHVKHWWETYWEKIITEEYGIYGVYPT
jgi:hypothetical protein